MANISSHRDMLVDERSEHEAGNDPVALPRYAALLTVIEYIWRLRSSLLRQARLAFLTAVAIVLLIPNTYESTTRLMPPTQDKSTPLAMLSAVAGGSNPLLGAAADMLGQKGPGALFVGVLQSDLVQDRLIDRYDLQHVYGCRYREDARRTLTSNTTIIEDRKSGIIRITVADHDQVRAQQLASAYVEELNSATSHLSTSAAGRERQFLEGRLAVVRQELDKSSARLASFSSENSAINIPEQAKALLGAAASLQGEKIAAESQLKGLEQIYAPTNIRIRSLKARIDELDKQLVKLGGDGQVQDSTTELYPAIRQLPKLGVEFAKLYRDTKTTETVFEMLTVQFEMAKVQEAKETATVRVLDPAGFPERKSGPHRTLIAIAIVLSWILAVIVVRASSDYFAGIDEQHPVKIVLESISKDFRAAVPLRSKYGSRIARSSSAIYKRIHQPVISSRSGNSAETLHGPE
jgi:capsule polysaccharide export protein KpsE/RkpR